MENVTKNTETIEISVDEYTRLKANASNVENLEQRVKLLEEALRLAKHKQFGKKSEKLSPVTPEELISLFDEAEAIQAVEDIKENIRTEEQEIEVAAHTRKKKTYILDGELPENIDVRVIEHTLSENDLSCPVCGETMTEIGVDVTRELVIIPARVEIIEHRVHAYGCDNCRKNGVKASVKKAPKENSVIPGSFATPEAIAHVMTQKFVMGSPLYRQEQEWKRQGIELTRQTMSNWLLKAVELYLNPLYEKLHAKLLEKDLLHADETTLQVLREEERAATTKSYMWLYRTGSDAEHPVVLYNYQPGRGREYPQNFLNGYKGYLQSDGYSVYHDINNNIIDVGCWAHLRRKFDEAKNALPKGKSPAMSATLKAIGYIANIYKLEKKFAKLSFEERYSARLKEEKPIVDEFFAWAKTLDAAPKSALGKALTYLCNQETYLLNYLMDGRLEIDNNRAERSIKPFVIGRKNFLFANTPRGAQSSAVMYSLIETAKENRLDPYRYLVYVLKTAKDLDQTKADWVDRLLPENAPSECSVNYRK